MKSFFYLLSIFMILFIFSFGMTQTITNNIALLNNGATAWDNGSYWHPVQQIDMDAIHAIDGFDSTYWAGLQSSNPQKMWIQFDQKYFIDKINIVELHQNSYILTGSIEYYDGNSWHLLTNINKSTADFYYEFTAVEAEQIVLNITSVQAPASWANKVALIHSLEINGYSSLDRGLLAYYPFNGNANDESGNGNNGFVTGAIPTNDRFDNLNSAYYFDGIDDYIDIRHALDSCRSISFWFKPNSIIDSTTSRISLLVRNTNNENDELTIYFEDQPNYKGKLVFARRIGHNPHGIASDTSFWKNQWYHVAAVINPQEGMKLYINGTIQSDSENSTEPVPVRTEYSAVGRWGNAAVRYFDGVIDDICIYNKALSQTEIDSLYHIGDWPITGIEDGMASTITNFKLFQNYPNPFNPETNIQFTINNPVDVKIYIYNSLGQKIKTLLNKKYTKGTQQAVWNGRNDFDTQVCSGTYFYQIQVGDQVQTKRMILLR